MSIVDLLLFDLDLLNTIKDAVVNVLLLPDLSPGKIHTHDLGRYTDGWVVNFALTSEL